MSSWAQAGPFIKSEASCKDGKKKPLKSTQLQKSPEIATTNGFGFSLAGNFINLILWWKRSTAVFLLWFFCSTDLPTACTRWVWSTFSSFFSAVLLLSSMSSIPLAPWLRIKPGPLSVKCERYFCAMRPPPKYTLVFAGLLLGGTR